MLSSVTEDRLLHHALKEGMISATDLADAAAESTNSQAPRNWGPRIDALIRRGRLREDSLNRLLAIIADSEANGSLTRASTLADPALRPADAQAFAATLNAASPQAQQGPLQAQPDVLPSTWGAEALGLAQTADGASATGAAPATVSSTGFPFPNWEKYEFLGMLGRGGMGAVYKARDRRLGRVVALKFLLGDEPGQNQRFMQEARAQARFEHPNICRVFEVGTVDSKPYIAMQFIDGLPLDKACRSLSALDKVQLIKDAVEAMHTAHEQGVIHRDIKPSNIMVSQTIEPDGSIRRSPVIMDFGLARDSGAAKGLTESGAVMGTPAYMSPEQARGEVRNLDRRTDVYSLGATLYDVLIGKPPFEDETVVKIILKVMNESPRPLRSHDPALPEALELVVGKCLNKEPAQRYQTAKDLAEDLGRFLSSNRVEARRLSYSYRLRYFARRNPALSGLAVALVASLLGLASFFVYSRVVQFRQAQLAKEEADVAQKLGQSVKDLEWMVRTAHLLPLHDTRRETGMVRQRMAEITAELRRRGLAGAERLGAYVLGRGHLALHEWDLAYQHLKRSQQLGYRDPELDYALGRVLGELYSRGIEEARKSGDKSFFEKRRRELEQEFLVPARVYLANSRQLKTLASSYVEALIDFYNQHYDAALLNAHLAQQQIPWLYEAAKLQGDVHMARALDARDHGDNPQAERHFADAMVRYEEAAGIGHSDYLVHESMAEAQIRQEEMDMYRGVNPESPMRLALAAADRAMESAPNDSHANTKKAFAVFFHAQYIQYHSDPKSALVLFNKQLELGRQAIQRHPTDAYAYEIAGIACYRLAVIQSAQYAISQQLLRQSFEYFDSAIRVNENFPWAYNDYAVSLALAVTIDIAEDKNPQELLERHINLSQKAIHLDQEYIVAYNSLLTAYLNAVFWGVKRGKSLETTLAEAQKTAQRAFAINKKFPYTHFNVGLLYHAALDGDVSTEIFTNTEEYANLGLASFRAASSIDPNGLPVHDYIANIYFALALAQQRKNLSATESINRGLQTIQECYRKRPQDSLCQAAEARLWTLQLKDTAGLTATQRISKLEQARRQARAAAQLNSDSEALSRVLAEICYQQAELLLAAGTCPTAQLDEGLRALDHALTLSTNWPLAQALRGGLWLMRARCWSDAVSQREPLRNAQAAFAAAFAGNPQLRGRFKSEEEATKRMAGAPTPTD